MELARIIISVLLLALFLYAKLLPHKDRLDGRNKSIFNFFDQLFTPVLNLLRRVCKPAQVGTGLFIDTSQLVLFAVLMVLLSFF